MHTGNRNINRWQLPRIPLIPLILFAVIILLTVTSKPSQATLPNYQHLIEQGIIQAVREPHELGLDYLQQQPVEIADESVLSAIYQAEQEISVLPEDILLRFDLGTNSPVRIGRLPDGDALASRADLEALGFVDSSGNPRSFTPTVLRRMFAIEGRNGGDLAITPEAQEILVSDASRKFLQATRTPTLNLVVRQKRTHEVDVLLNVNANAVCRDALNSILNQTLSRV